MIDPANEGGHFGGIEVDAELSGSNGHARRPRTASEFDHASAADERRVEGLHQFGVSSRGLDVNLKLVGKTVFTDDRLHWWDGDAGRAGYQLAEFGQLLGADPSVVAVEGRKRHGKFFKRAVAGTFTEPVDRRLYPVGAGLHRGEGVGEGEPIVVVSVNSHGDSGSKVARSPNQRAHCPGRGHAGRVGDRYDIGATVDGGTI